MDLFAEINRRLDNTKIQVIEGDIPKGDWLFNGHGIVFVEKNGGKMDAEQAQAILDNADNPDAPTRNNLLVIELANNVHVEARKAGEAGLLHQAAAQMSPLYGTIFGFLSGAQLGVGPMGAFAGFAAGTLVGRNDANFACELTDGRRFICVADYKIYRRIVDVALSSKE